MKTKTISSCSFLLILIFFSVTILVGSLLSSPHQSDIGKPPNKLKAEQVSFPSESGSNISGWFVPGKNNMGGILLLHGVRSNRLQMIKRAKFLNEYGYSVLLIDFQAHGESLGERITFGYLESLDADAAFTFLENKISHKNIGVVGVSLGGAAVLLGKVAKRSNAIILESVYPTIEEAIKNRIALRLGELGRYLAPLLTLQIKPRLGINIDQLHPIDHIKNVKGAIFVVCGSIDKHTTMEESKRMFEHANEPKQLWVIDGAAHVDFSSFAEDRYKTKVLSFFKHYL
jgi:esterase/lipase